jgi:AcrR family transcriptional regulator
MEAGTEARPRPGRPLDERTSQAILRAALELMLERGYGAMSIEGVAHRAGVGKPAIYRRYRDKAHLVAAAIRSIMPPVDLPDTGDTLQDLRELARQAAAQREGPFPTFLGVMLSEEQRQPELIEAFRETMLRPRREMFKTFARRGIERGDIRPELDLEQAADAFAGNIIVRHIAGLPFDDDWFEAAIEFQWRGMRAG